MKKAKLTITAMALAIVLSTVGNAADNNPSAFGSPTPHSSTRAAKVDCKTRQSEELRGFYAGHHAGYREGFLSGGLSKIVYWDENYLSTKEIPISLDFQDPRESDELTEGMGTLDSFNKGYFKGYYPAHTKGAYAGVNKLVRQVVPEEKAAFESGADSPVLELKKMSDEERAVRYNFTENYIEVSAKEYMAEVHTAVDSFQSLETITITCE